MALGGSLEIAFLFLKYTIVSFIVSHDVGYIGTPSESEEAPFPSLFGCSILISLNEVALSPEAIKQGRVNTLTLEPEIQLISATFAVAENAPI